MWQKRVFYPVLAGMLALVFFVYYQISLLDAKLQNLLRQQLPALQFKTYSLDYFPTPRLNLVQPQSLYKQWTISAHQLSADFSWLSLFGLSPKVKQIELIGGVVSDQRQVELGNIYFKLEDIDHDYNLAKLTLMATTPANNRLNINAIVQRFANGAELNQLNLNIEMAEGYFLNNQTMTLSADKLSLSQQQNILQMALQQGQLNQLPITSAVLHYYIPVQQEALPSSEPHFELQLKQADGSLQVSSRQQLSGNQLLLKGNRLALAPLLGFLKLPELLNGKADFEGDAQFNQGVLTQGKLQLQVSDSVLNGLNLLDLVSQYYPIRYYSTEKGATQYADRMATPFDQVNISLNWDRQKLNLTEVLAQGKELNLNGYGEMNLTDFNCRFELRLSPNAAGYSQYQLPVSLFGPCRSPQYRISLDKKLGEQLKQMLRDKLNEKK